MSVQISTLLAILGNVKNITIKELIALLVELKTNEEKAQYLPNQKQIKCGSQHPNPRYSPQTRQQIINRLKDAKTRGVSLNITNTQKDGSGINTINRRMIPSKRMKYVTEDPNSLLSVAYYATDNKNIDVGYLNFCALVEDGNDDDLLC